MTKIAAREYASSFQAALVPIFTILRLYDYLLQAQVKSKLGFRKRSGNTQGGFDLEVGLLELEAPTKLELTKLRQIKMQLFQGIGHDISSLSTVASFLSSTVITMMPILWQLDRKGSNGASETIVNLFTTIFYSAPVPHPWLGK